MNNQIVITISGAAGAGKTTTARDILNTLQKSGYNVKADDREQMSDDLHYMPPEYEAREAVKLKTEACPIIVRTITTWAPPTKWAEEEWLAKNPPKLKAPSRVDFTGKTYEEVWQIEFERMAELEKRIGRLERHRHHMGTFNTHLPVFENDL